VTVTSAVRLDKRYMTYQSVQLSWTKTEVYVRYKRDLNTQKSVFCVVNKIMNESYYPRLRTINQSVYAKRATREYFNQCFIVGIAISGPSAPVIPGVLLAHVST
jgi:hypothetical protein